MKPAAVVLSSVLLSAAAAALTVKLLDSGARAAEGASSPTEQIRIRIESLEGSVARLEKAIHEARAPQAASAAPAASARVSGAEIDAAVARWLEKNGPAANSNGVAAAGGADTRKSSAPQGSAAILAALRDPQRSSAEKQKLWKQAREAGLLDELVGAFEKLAKENPSATSEFELGQAYVEKIMTVPDLEKGQWATLADRAFDQALEFDSQHWGARFSKAVGLSFWPPIFGKQGEAISHFETLRKQQEQSGGVQADYAQTYQFLGSLYQQQGKSDKAAEVWQAGVKLFPDNEQLKKLLQGSGAKPSNQ